ncbi:uncharacterized protein J8A68_004182 [[Candida] subhashii]|uniref:Uncharacterized protein n=1 Tax=[Candida] subhashii TaxID=561895 RepID=A0A8J5QKU7_9ASCO|nr:uncharacterized protein J8A68_004182 [[Candida] subhashii]KAG7662288.1 hypothetical protein J8A68_004182 [[Candida] subhashii]
MEIAVWPLRPYRFIVLIQRIPNGALEDYVRDSGLKQFFFELLLESTRSYSIRMSLPTVSEEPTILITSVASTKQYIEHAGYVDQVSLSAIEVLSQFLAQNGVPAYRITLADHNQQASSWKLMTSNQALGS